MSELASDSTTTGKPKRLLTIVTIGLACLCLVQFVTAKLAERTFAKERDALLSPSATIDRFHQLFTTSKDTITRNLWMGIPAMQNPNDVWITQEILYNVKPDFVIEAGTFQGGSSVLWAMILREINPQGRVITIDIQEQATEAQKLPTFKERVDFVLGSSIAPNVVAEVKRRVAGHKVVLILDSNHRKEHVLAELRAYADIIQVGGYIIVQDSNVNGHPALIDPDGPVYPFSGRPGPWEAVAEFLAADKRFAIDGDRERLLLTLNPSGYLRRMR
jgi:cephalosporin hydroxylase